MKLSEEQFDDVIRTNVRGVWLMARELCRR